MSITLVSPRETELQKQVIELAENLRNLGWEFELYKTGARATNQKLLDQIRELKADNENLRAYAKHERSLGAEAFAMENLDLTQQVEILKAKLAEYEKQEQEPVAYMLTTRNFGLGGETWDTTEYRDYPWDSDCVPLYTKGTP